jgi:hypothetical protein
MPLPYYTLKSFIEMSRLAKIEKRKEKIRNIIEKLER